MPVLWKVDSGDKYCS